jgi:hypothetical protein
MKLASEKQSLERLILDSLEEVCRLMKHMACVQLFLPEKALSEQLHYYGLNMHCKMLHVLGIVVDYASMPWYSTHLESLSVTGRLMTIMQADSNG